MVADKMPYRHALQARRMVSEIMGPYLAATHQVRLETR